MKLNKTVLSYLGICFVFVVVIVMILQNLVIPPSRQKLEQELKVPTGSQPLPTIPVTGNVFVSGIQKPFGIAFTAGTVYVSGDSGKKLFAILDGKAQGIASLNGVADVFEMNNGTLVATVFYDNKLVTLTPKGETKTLFTNLAGPTGITADNQNTLYITNYFDGSVNSMTIDGKKIKTVAQNLSGPAGIVYRPSDQSLIVAEYALDSIVIIGKQNTKRVRLSKLTHLKSVYISSQNAILATATLDNKGVIVQIKEDGSYFIRARTNLPDPIIGAFSPSGLVYVTSPNDPEGRILKIQL